MIRNSAKYDIPLGVACVLLGFYLLAGSDLVGFLPAAVSPLILVSAFLEARLRGVVACAACLLALALAGFTHTDFATAAGAFWLFLGMDFFRDAVDEKRTRPEGNRAEVPLRMLAPLAISVALALFPLHSDVQAGFTDSFFAPIFETQREGTAPSWILTSLFIAPIWVPFVMSFRSESRVASSRSQTG